MQEMLPIRVLLLSESRLLREALADAFNSESDLLVVGGCSRSAEAFALMTQSPCDVLLIDGESSEWNSHTVNDFRSSFPSTKIVVLNTERGESPYLETFHDAIAGCLLKESSAEDVVATIRGIAHRERVRPSPFGSH